MKLEHLKNLKETLKYNPEKYTQLIIVNLKQGKPFSRVKNIYAFRNIHFPIFLPVSASGVQLK